MAIESRGMGLLCLWKHWFWITKSKTTKMIPVYLILFCQIQMIVSAPIGAVDSKQIPFKKYSLVNSGKGENKIFESEKTASIPAMQAVDIPSHKILRVSLGAEDLDDDALDEIVDGHNLGRIFVTIPTSSSSTTTTTTTMIPSISKELINTDNPEPIKEESTIKESLNSTSGKEQEILQTEDESKSDIIRINSTSIESKSADDERLPSANILPEQQIENLTLLDESEVNSSSSNIIKNSGRKSKVLADNLTNKNILTRSTVDNEAINPTSAVHPVDAFNKQNNFLIHFSESDKLELMNSQNNALIGDKFNLNDVDDIRRNPRPVNVGMISGICFSVLALFCAVTIVGAIMYRRRYINKPQTLSEPDSSGYIDDSIIRDNSDEMYSLDNDSFLNSLEAMTIQNYWTDSVKHTKL